MGHGAKHAALSSALLWSHVQHRIHNQYSGTSTVQHIGRWCSVLSYWTDYWVSIGIQQAFVNQMFRTGARTVKEACPRRLLLNVCLCCLCQGQSKADNHVSIAAIAVASTVCMPQPGAAMQACLVTC